MLEYLYSNILTPSHSSYLSAYEDGTGLRMLEYLYSNILEPSHYSYLWRWDRVFRNVGI